MQPEWFKPMTMLYRQQRWLRRLVNSGRGDDDKSGCDVEAMIHRSDEK
jgi:hypothetical protein